MNNPTLAFALVIVLLAIYIGSILWVMNNWHWALCPAWFIVTLGAVLVVGLLKGLVKAGSA